MQLRIFGDPVLFHIGPLPFTETMVTSTVVTVALIALAVLFSYLVRLRPRHWLAVVAFWCGEFRQTGGGIIGRQHTIVANLAGSLFLFIACCNIAGQLPGACIRLQCRLGHDLGTGGRGFSEVPIAGIHSNGVWGYLPGITSAPIRC
ncbi:MAG: hypothetical protein R3F37_11950 [Candidatus Competibacteraceae bacterium]